MNSVFLGCTSCRVIVDAGYRWATSTLEEPGIVDRSSPFQSQAVLAAAEYWSPDGPESAWLTEGVLPRVRAFLDAHAAHTLRLGSLEELAGTDDMAFLDWLDVSEDAELGPRYFREVLGLTSWADALEWIRARREPPWWWHDTDLIDAVRRRFQELLADRER